MREAMGDDEAEAARRGGKDGWMASRVACLLGYGLVERRGASGIRALFDPFVAKCALGAGPVGRRAEQELRWRTRVR